MSCTLSSPLPYNRQTALASTIAADNAANIAGKTILTTGVTQGGLGATFVEAIAQYKLRLLILAGRSTEKVGATVRKTKSNPRSSDVEIKVLELDLASQKRVRQAANVVWGWQDVQHIAVLVNSAGIMAGPYKTTQEGIGNQFGSNHIGHFFPRIVNVASDGHRFGGVYEQWEAYEQSKTADILFSRALAEKLGPKGLKAYSLHPGEGLTEVKGAKDKEIGWNRELDLKNLDECAATHVAAAFDPRLDDTYCKFRLDRINDTLTRVTDYNGVYLENGNLSADVEKLWKLSEKLVGQEFAY
ncbi:NAD(P)-binding protein [Macroventuria anomochaeta]|uniref:NAD(P)-binding protein n=1 Tax=Macroventuria anomochaeta TaxID=301207 RepID=A0ACB6RN67_9PLEO|nr:NAD(P)-binding protein [Macroventuria anomochaeta]KAF2622359.1 NAD(P)-binding protein [Macroventuria anomochaeta]